MARPLTQDESDALAKSGILLRFAAENIKDFPQAIVSTISAAQDSKESDTWDQKVATDFWITFNALCALIKPVTIDTLSTNLREIPTPKWKFWRNGAQPISLSRRSAGRYLFLLMFLLFVAVFLSFLVTTTANLNSEIEKLIDSANQVAERVVTEVDQLEPVLGTKSFSEATPEQQKTIALIQNQLQELNQLLDQIAAKTKFLTKLSSLNLTVAVFHEENLDPRVNIEGTRAVIFHFYTTRRDVGANLLKESIKRSVISSSVLPIVLGIMGACAYVIRLISDQIKDSTFSSTSPIRHMVRVALGGLAGVVIGFVGIANVGSLSPSALAFIAGYAVEPVFATFDGIAEKFRR